MLAPQRNRIAEYYASKAKVQCPNTGCNKKVDNSDLSRHLQICDYTMVKCKYALLGCSITNIKCKMDNHKCDINYDQLLKKFISLKQDQENMETQHNITIEQIEETYSDRINELEGQIYNNEEEIEELTLELHKKDNDLVQFQDIIFNSSVMVQHTFKDIWYDFNIGINFNENKSKIVRRCHFDRNNIYKITLSFQALRFYSDSSESTNGYIDINIKLHCFSEQNIINQRIDSIIKIGEVQGFDKLYSDEYITFGGYVIDHWDSSWKRLFRVKVNNWQQAGEAIKKLNIDSIKVFVKV